MQYASYLDHGTFAIINVESNMFISELQPIDIAIFDFAHPVFILSFFHD